MFSQVSICSRRGVGDGGCVSSDDHQMSLAGDGYVQRVTVADCGFSGGGGEQLTKFVC